MEVNTQACKAKFTIPITSWFSFDDALNITYFLLNLTVVILATVNTVKTQQKDISEEESKKIMSSQKIIRLVSGGLIVLMGIYNITIFFSIIEYSASNRIIIGITQLLLGIVFIILNTYSLKDNN